MKPRISAFATMMCLMAVSACSNGSFIYGRALGDVSKITGVETGLEEIVTTERTTALTGAAEGPPLIVGFKAIRVAIPLAGQSGPSQTYASPDGVVIAMNNGFVSRVTGLGFDLNGSYLPSDSAWWAGLDKASSDGASTSRVLEYWERGREKRDKFYCTLSASSRDGRGTVVDETCKRYFEPESFVNRYWLTADGSIECSRQLIHPQFAPLQFFSTEQQALTLDLTKNGC